jgi:TatA/E family protein of Tat protein translocase
MGPLGWQETMFIFVLALLVFGPKKLPELGKTIGKAMTEFRRASNELKSTFDREMREIERETESVKEAAQSYHSEIQSSTSTDSTYDYNYDSSYYDNGAYGSESTDSTVSNPTTVSASAIQGAESEASAASEGEHTATTEVAEASVPADGYSVEPVSKPPEQNAPASDKRA